MKPFKFGCDTTISTDGAVNGVIYLKLIGPKDYRVAFLLDKAGEECKDFSTINLPLRVNNLRPLIDYLCKLEQEVKPIEGAH